MVAGLVMGACGGGDPPSCQHAISNFYETAKCTFVGSDGSQTSEVAALNSCHGLISDAPSSQCKDAVDAWLFCLDGVPNTTQCGSCADELDGILRCR